MIIRPEHYADLIGAPFKLGARGPDAFDCYGLVQFVLARAGIQTPDYRSPEKGSDIRELIAAMSRNWVRVDNKPGALIVYRIPGTWHCGLNLGQGRMLHAWEGFGGVNHDDIEYWRRREVGAYVYEGGN